MVVQPTSLPHLTSQESVSCNLLVLDPLLLVGPDTHAVTARVEATGVLAAALLEEVLAGTLEDGGHVVRPSREELLVGPVLQLLVVVPVRLLHERVHHEEESGGNQER